MLKKIIAWWLNSSCMAATCALFLTIASLLQLHIKPSLASSIASVILISCGTLLIYNLHYLGKHKSTTATQRFSSPNTHYVLISISMLACIASITFIPLHVVGIILVFAAISLSYSHSFRRLKFQSFNKYGIVKPFLLAASSFIHFHAYY